MGCCTAANDSNKKGKDQAIPVYGVITKQDTDEKVEPVLEVKDIELEEKRPESGQADAKNTIEKADEKRSETQ